MKKKFANDIIINELNKILDPYLITETEQKFYFHLTTPQQLNRCDTCLLHFYDFTFKKNNVGNSNMAYEVGC